MLWLGSHHWHHGWRTCWKTATKCCAASRAYSVSCVSYRLSHLVFLWHIEEKFVLFTVVLVLSDSWHDLTGIMCLCWMRSNTQWSLDASQSSRKVSLLVLFIWTQRFVGETCRHHRVTSSVSAAGFSLTNRTESDIIPLMSNWQLMNYSWAPELIKIWYS